MFDLISAISAYNSANNTSISLHSTWGLRYLERKNVSVQYK
jgi:hypothetical protein